MRRAVVRISLVVSALLTVPSTPTLAIGPAGGGHRGFSGPSVPSGVGASRFGASGFGARLARTPVPIGFGVRPFGFGITPGFRATPLLTPGNPAWTWSGSPPAFSASPGGFALTPFHTPYAAPYWGSTAATLAIKPDEASVLESESKMEEQVRALQAQGTTDESSEDAGNADSDDDKSDWQPL
jgi:hypothetical protein